MKLKRFLALALTLILVLGMLPAQTLATETTSRTCENCGQPTHEGDCTPCAECGTVHTGDCSVPQIVNDEEEEPAAPATCENCGQSAHEGDCANESSPEGEGEPLTGGEGEGNIPTACENCGQPTHEGDCTPCADCNTVHTGECAANPPAGEADPSEEKPQEPVCSCTPVEGVHAETCPLYVKPQEPVCSCTPVEGVHAETCPLYMKPTEPVCSCGSTDGVHTDGCPLYVKPETPEAPEAPKVGDKIWIKPGSTIYAKAQEKDSYTLKWVTHEIKIVEIILDDAGAPAWYKYEYTDLGFLEGLVIGRFRYVKVESTSVEKPDITEEPENNGIPACSCENPPENIAQHADSCQRKAFIAELTNGKTAEEIYENWDNFQEADQNDILNLLEVYNPTVWEELKELIDPSEGEIETDSADIGEGGTLAAMWDPSVFGGVNASMTATPVETTSKMKSAVNSAVAASLGGSTKVLKMIAADITFVDKEGNSVQPVSGKSVSLNFGVPADQVPEDANKMAIIHIGDDGQAEVVGSKYLYSNDNIHAIRVDATGFSHYITAFVNSKYNGTLLRDVLGTNGQYSVRTIDSATVNMFDYEPGEFNGTNDITEKFLFLGGGKAATSVANYGVNDSSAGYANQGILKNTLVNGVPVMQYGTDVGDALFNPNTDHAGKTSYPDVDFEFIYDSETRNYIYSSALNHAQYNETTKRVELYTDTLGVVNAMNRDLLSGATVGKGTMCDVFISGGVVKGTVTGADPYFDLDVTDFTAAAGDKIVLKVKFNKDVSGQETQLFFKCTGESFTEERSFQTYFPQGKKSGNDYIYEIVIDTSDSTYKNSSQYWTGTITTFRPDVVDFRDPENPNFSGTTFEISEFYVVPKADAALNNNKNAGFYPFSKIENSYPTTATSGFNAGTWSTNIGSATGDQYYLGSRAIYNGTSTNDSVDHLYLGMSASIPFYLPESKQVNGQDIVYTFNGDDDLWVFIDDKLVLDVGGGHGMIKGTINFTTGMVTVSNAVTVTGMTTGTVPEANVTSTFKISPGDHTMKIFYLERAGSISNCFMKFNLPIVPASSLTVTKNVEKTAETELYMPSTDEQFTFTLLATNETQTVQNVDVSNWVYTIWEGTESDMEKHNPVNGQITLKDGQTARFETIDENTKVIVTESEPAKYSGSSEFDHTAITVNGVSKTTAEVQTKTGKVQEIVFTNYYKDRYFDLTIIKEGWQTIDPGQTFLFHVVCEETGVDMNVTIKENGSITIKHLKFGTYTITEDTGWSWRYTPEAGEQTVTAKNDTETVTFKNKRDDDKWFDGNSHAQNIFDGVSSGN